ncbi:MAG: transaldolase [Cellvibrionales bacterium]|nr:transaldolase [Cellvibrionales bacterium]
MNKLDQLVKYSTIVADTGDIQAIKSYKPLDATTNPSLLLKASELPHYEPLLNASIAYAKNTTARGCLQQIAADKLSTLIGQEILSHVDGRVSTEVDARLSFDTTATIDKAKRIIDLYGELGIDKSRVLIKIASTWEGIQAAKILEAQGIQCNMTLIFSFEQAKACADVGAYLISPFVGRILDWYKKHENLSVTHIDQDPGVQSVRAIHSFYKNAGYNTVVMAASFRNTEQIEALAGCDRLTISPTLLNDLKQDTGELTASLKPKDEDSCFHEKPSPMLETDFRFLVNDNAMATEKLAEGIRLFTKDQLLLEKKLAKIPV